MATAARVRGATPCVCGTCCEPIDLEALLAANSVGERYVHQCGRVLLKGRGTAA